MRNHCLNCRENEMDAMSIPIKHGVNHALKKCAALR
jgi:hypothetical protein